MQDIKSLADNGNLVFHDSSWSSVSAEAKDFISYLLTWNATNHPTASEALAHRWLLQCAPSSWQPARQYNAQEKAIMIVYQIFLAIREETRVILRVLNSMGLSPKERLSRANVKSAYVSDWLSLPLDFTFPAYLRLLPARLFLL